MSVQRLAQATPRRPLGVALAMASAFPLLAAAQGVRVDFAAGPVTAINSAGVERPLARGSEIAVGEIVRTGSGQAQLRFSDGAVVALSPETEFRIDDYRYAGGGSGEEKGFFSLIRGGLRTITGWVGRTQRENYRVTTKVATIGIRGTEYTARLNPAGDELHVSTGEGLVEVCGAGGCLLLASGESGVVRGDEEPQRTEVRPSLALRPEGSSLPVYSAVEVKDSAGEPNLPVLTAGAAGSGMNSVIGIGGLAGAQTRDNATLTLSGGNLVSFVSGGLTTGQGTASGFEQGNDGIIGWGRWAGGTLIVDGASVPLNVDQGLHHFWGVPTAVMPMVGSVNYTLLGATSPTEVTGAWAPGALNSVALTANFGTGSVSSTVNVTIGPVGPTNNFVVSGTGSIGGNGFSITTMSGVGGGCVSGCTGDMSGRFFGTTAERVGIAYKIVQTGGNTIIGAAALKQ